VRHLSGALVRHSHGAAYAHAIRSARSEGLVVVTNNRREFNFASPYGCAT
jgi:hypothetical protein